MGKIVIDPVTRIEGHLKIEAIVDGGRVKEAKSSGTLFRRQRCRAGSRKNASSAGLLDLTRPSCAGRIRPHLRQRTARESQDPPKQSEENPQAGVPGADEDGRRPQDHQPPPAPRPQTPDPGLAGALSASPLLPGSTPVT